MLLLPSTIKVLVLSIMEINMCLRHWFISCLIRNWISLGILTIWCISKKYTSFRVNNTWNTLAETRVTLFRCSSYLLICCLVFLSLLGCILTLGLVLVCYNTCCEVVAGRCCLACTKSCACQTLVSTTWYKTCRRVDLMVERCWSWGRHRSLSWWFANNWCTLNYRGRCLSACWRWWCRAYWCRCFCTRWRWCRSWCWLARWLRCWSSWLTCWCWSTCRCWLTCWGRLTDWSWLTRTRLSLNRLTDWYRSWGRCLFCLSFLYFCLRLSDDWVSTCFSCFSCFWFSCDDCFILFCILRCFIRINSLLLSHHKSCSSRGQDSPYTR